MCQNLARCCQCPYWVRLGIILVVLHLLCHHVQLAACCKISTCFWIGLAQPLEPESWAQLQSTLSF